VAGVKTGIAVEIGEACVGALWSVGFEGVMSTFLAAPPSAGNSGIASPCSPAPDSKNTERETPIAAPKARTVGERWASDDFIFQRWFGCWPFARRANAATPKIARNPPRNPLLLDHSC
jgi:hypothetical protein